MGTFFKEQLHLKEPFQTYWSLTPLQHTTRTDRMKFLLPILLISLAALCNIQPAATQDEAPVVEISDEEFLELIDDDLIGDDGSSDEMMREASVQTVQLRWGYHQKTALKKWAAFFRYADTNKTGALTWSEYWNAVHKILHKKGWSHEKIMKYRPYFYKHFKHYARGGLIRWKDVQREVRNHVKP